MPQGRKYSYEESIAFLQKLIEERSDWVWNREKMKVSGGGLLAVPVSSPSQDPALKQPMEPTLKSTLDQESDKSEHTTQPFEFLMPWSFPVPSADISLEDYLEDLPLVPPPYLLILMQAGHSALGYFDEGEVVMHKVIKKYMVRAGQGKAQIGYLGSRGKSKAGSRIRLANSVRFFEDINEKLTEWGVADEVERILVSCPVRLGPLWYGSKTPPPFEKEDPRIRKVPLDVHRPDHEELLRVNRVGLCGYWVE